MKVFGCLCVLACKSGHLFSNQMQGTHFFMVMTEFLHAVSLFREQAAISSHMINQVRLKSTFILRRLLRIYPAYALTVLATQVIYKDPSREFHLMDCLSLSSRITSHVWFLRVELLYYVLVLVLVPLKVTIRMITQFFKGFKDLNSGQKATVLIMASLCVHSIVQWGQPFFQYMETWRGVTSKPSSTSFTSMP